MRSQLTGEERFVGIIEDTCVHATNSKISGIVAAAAGGQIAENTLLNVIVCSISVKYLMDKKKVEPAVLME